MKAPVLTPSHAAAVTRNAAALGIGELLSRVIAFGATIYVARNLGVDAYAIIGVGMAILLYATTLADAGLEHTGPREAAAAPADAVGVLVWSVMVARFAWAIVLGLLMLGVTSVAFSGSERVVLALFALALLPAGLNMRWVYIGLGRPVLVSISRVAAEVVRAVIILSVVRGPADLYVVPLAQVAGDTVGAVTLLLGARLAGMSLRPQFDLAVVAGVARRALPMAVSGVLAVMIYNVDVLFLRAFRDHTEVGLYLAGYTLLNFLGVLGHVIALALIPAFTRLRADRAAELSLLQISSTRAFAIGLPIAVGGSLIAPLLIQLVFGPEYHRAAEALEILVWVMPILLVRSVAQALLVADTRQDLVLRSTIAGAVSNVGLNAVAVPLFGMHGAAITTVAAEALRMAVALRWVRRTGRRLPPLSRFVRTAAAATVMGAVLLVLRPTTVWAAVAAGVLLYCVAMIVTGAVRDVRSPQEPQDDPDDDEDRQR